jgi:hypothetical protein
MGQICLLPLARGARTRKTGEQEVTINWEIHASNGCVLAMGMIGCTRGSGIRRR